MKIVLTGATGFIGTHLVKSLAKDGHELVVLSRNPDRVMDKLNVPLKAYAWDSTQPVPQEALVGADAIIHLAGEGIAEKRWSKAQKEKILATRVEGTRHLVESIQKLPGKKPSIFVGASAIGFYGPRGDETLTESSSAGEGYLSHVCQAWEKEVSPLEGMGLRTCLIRIGIVLGAEGGALKKMLPIFKTGMAGPLGNGKQWMSWIHVQDLVSLLKFAVTSEKAKGVLNGTAPEPVTNAEFTKVLASTLHRPAFLPAPAIAIKLAMGELATLVLDGQKVLPQRTREVGFTWSFPKLDAALADILKKKAPQLAGKKELAVEQWLPIPVDEVFPFFSNEKNLEALTPGWLHFNVVGKSSEKIQEGTLIDYQLKIRGIPVRWRSRIDRWEPNKAFVDVQVKGPYSYWHHTHEFEALGNGTLIKDIIRYSVPGGPLSVFLEPFVARDVRQIFNYRRKAISQLLLKK